MVDQAKTTLRFLTQKAIEKIREPIRAYLHAKYPEAGICITVEKAGRRASCGYWIGFVASAYGNTSYMGCDGESYWRYNCGGSFEISVPDMKALTAQEFEKHFDFVEKFAEGKIRHDAVVAEQAKASAEYNKRKEAEAIAKAREVSFDEMNERYRQMELRKHDTVEKKLEFFRDGVICADSYRTEFLGLIDSLDFWNLVMDTIKKPKAFFDYGFELRLLKETSKRNLDHFSIGGPIKAFQYLTQDWK